MTAKPKNETVFLSYHNKSGKQLFILTSKKDSRDWYYLYELANGKCNKLGKSRNPKELEEKFKVYERMCGE